MYSFVSVVFFLLVVVLEVPGKVFFLLPCIGSGVVSLVEDCFDTWSRWGVVSCALPWPLLVLELHAMR